MFKQNKQAFTLIELLVVVLIIGILAAVALPQYNKVIAKSQYASIKDLTESIAKAEEIYHLENGVYTHNFENLSLSMPQNKKQDSTSNWYRYNWGRCFTSNTPARCCCYHSQAKLGYCKWFSRDPNTPNKRTCMVLDTTDVMDWHNSICKEETKATSGIVSNGDKLIQWKY